MEPVPPLEASAAPRARWTWQRAARKLVQLAIAAAALLLAWRLVGSLSWDELRERFLEAQPVLVGVGAFCLSAKWLLWQFRWGWSLAAADRATPFRLRAAALMAAVFINHVALRFFGVAFRARYLAARRRESFPGHFAIVLFDQSLHHTATFFYTLVCGSYVSFILGWKTSGFGLVIALIVSLAILPFVVGQHFRVQQVAGWLGRRTNRSSRLGSLLKSSSELPRFYGSLMANRSLVYRSLAITFGVIAFNVVGQWLLFRALGSQISLPLVAAVTGLGTLAGTISGLPGGLGPMEAALISGYVLLGIDRVDAVAGVLLFRGLHYILVLLYGLPSLVALELGGKARRNGPSA